MLRSLPLAALLLALLPAAATASAVGLDVRVDDTHLTETTCPDGVTTIVEETEQWSAGGSRNLDGSGGIVQIFHEKITATWRKTGDELELIEREVDVLSEKDRGFGYVARRSGSRLVIALKRFSPRKEKLRVRIPRLGGEKRLGLPEKRKRDEQPPDAAGCVPAKVHIKAVYGSIEHLRWG